MTTAIRLRDIEIVATIKETGQQSIRKIAKIAGLSKDKVQRGLNAILKRNIHPESEFWETKTGQEWLRILVFGVLLEFGIKGNQGADRISSFFERIRLDKHIYVTPTSLRTLLKRMEELLIRYQKEHESECAGKSNLEIIASGDETFFKDMMVLVMMDLNSGYILVEEEAIDRSYETWRSKVEGRMKELGLTALHFISDRGKSLMKLALSCLGCAAGADIFHGQYDISKWLGMGFYRKKGQAEKQLKKLEEALESLKNKGTNPQRIFETEQHVAQDKAQLKKIEKGKQAYSDAQEAVSEAVHAFSSNNCCEAQTSECVEKALEEQASKFEEIAQTHSIPDNKGALKKFRRQIKDIASIVDAWWLWAIESLVGYTLGKEQQDWLLYTLLPVVYWHQQMNKTQNSEIKKAYKKAWQRALETWNTHPVTHTMSSFEIDQWLVWAEWISGNFHRASSAVEGRNGCLSQMYHNGRGLTTTRLQALTVIHNFDIKQRDGSTAAERLFNTKLPELFDWLVKEMGELPLARQGRKCKVSNPLNLETVAA